MGYFSTARWVRFAVFAIGVVGVLSAGARAALVINLQLVGGGNGMTVSQANAGQDIPILVYATVTGVNPVTTNLSAKTGNFDGIQYTYYNIESGAGKSGAVAGGIDDGSANPAYAPLLDGGGGGFGASGSQTGVVKDVNGDGIADLGSIIAMTDIAKPRADEAVFNNTFENVTINNPTNSASVIVGGTNNNSVSFLLETLYFKLGSVIRQGQSTTFYPVIPVINSPYVGANYFLDDPSNQTTGFAYTYNNYSAGTSVTFIVPEPGTILMIAIGSLSLLRRPASTRSR